MKDPGQTTAAYVLRRFDFSENSQIARLYTREFGRISVLAKGIRRPNPDLLGPLDLGARGIAVVRPKKGDQLSLLTRWRTETGHPGQRLSLERMVGAAHLCELWFEGTRDFDPDPALFDLLAESMTALETTTEETTASVIAAAELRWLVQAGFAPALDGCVACGRTAPPNAAVKLSPGRGGVVCGRCVDPATPGLVALTAGERRSLFALADAGPAEAFHVPLGKKDGAAVRRALDRLIEHALERDLRSSRYLGAF